MFLNANGDRWYMKSVESKKGEVTWQTVALILVLVLIVVGIIIIASVRSGLIEGLNILGRTI